MSISFPLTVSAFWEQIRFAGRPEFELLQYKQQSMDGGGNILSAKFGQPKWRADVSTANGRHDADMNIQAMIKLLTGRDGKFLAYDIRRPFPLSDPGGSMLANGSIVSIGGEAASGNVVFGTYRYERVSVTLAQAVSMVSDAGTYFDADGVLQTAAANAVRVDYGPFANYIRNFKGTGAVAGTPGTAPTNMVIVAANGLARQITGTGTENGQPYVDIRWSGTASASTAWVLYFDTALVIPAAQNQIWTIGVGVKVVSGSLPSTAILRIEEFNAAGASLANQDASIAVTSSLVRLSSTKTLANASTTTIRPGIYGNVANGAVVDFTLRIAVPLLNHGSTAITYPRLPIGIMAETAFANILKRSREFDHADWGKTRCSIAANVSSVIDPWGGTSADKMVEDSSNNTHIMLQPYATANYVNHVIYVLAKAAGRTKIMMQMSNASTSQCSAIYDLVTGAITGVTSGIDDFTGASARSIELGNGWYWCELEALKVTGDTDCIPILVMVDGSGNTSYTGDGVSGIYLAHAQLEEGTIGHMPIVTTTAAVPRAADALTINALGTNDFVLTYDDGSTTIHNARVGNWFPNIANLARPRIRKWTATRVNPPSAAAVKIKTKGSDNHSLSLKGLPPFFTLSLNDKLSVLDGAGRYALLEVMEAVTANIAGDTAEFEVQPFLPTWLAVDQTVILAKPLCKFQILAGGYKPSTVSGNRSSGASFSMISVP